MSKCGKVKNPCKYCFEQVTNKTGLQCEGACKKWAHFKCLHYTPGKISDIKAGIIKVMCPCPDCETTQIKEYIVDTPYTCSNTKCPANTTIINQPKPPLAKCDPIECSLNKLKDDDCPPRRPHKCSNRSCNNEPIECPVAPTTLGAGAPCLPPQPSCMTKKKRHNSPAVEKDCPPVETFSNSSFNSCPNPTCPSKTSISDNGKKQQLSMACALREMCGTVGKLTVQIKDLMGKLNELT